MVRTPCSEGPGSIPGQGTKRTKITTAGHHSKHFTWVNSLNPHKNPMTSSLLLSPFTRKKLGPERLYNLPRASVFSLVLGHGFKTPHVPLTL